MYTLITIFYVSLAGIVGMILLKRREVKTGVPSLVSRAGAGVDHIFQAIFAAVRRGISHINRRTFVEIGHWIAFHVLKSARTVYVEVKDRTLAHPHGRKLLNAVRGRGEVKDHGASFYLRKISDKE